MQKSFKKILVIKFLFILIIKLNAQNSIEPIANYNFNNNTIADEKGNSTLTTYNQTSLINDTQRGNVLKFSSASKDYAVINKNLLNTSTSTLSFFLFWESDNSSSWHQLFELYNSNTNSNIFFTPQNGWGSNQCSVISDNKEYSIYEAVSANPISKDRWVHFAFTFEEQQVTIYIDGQKVSRSYLTFTPNSLANSLIYLGGNPNRTNNYYISAKLDEIKFFDKALAPNQVVALANESEIPATSSETTNWEYGNNTIQIEIDLSDKKQIMQNFGASDGWNTERIGKYWPTDKKEKLAELLFSTEKDINGNPKGIGLSAWRFNIGAGTAEQGDASRISKEERRTEGFLNPDGTTYNWNKQEGQQWFLKKAAIDYNVNHIIGWQNSPPVAFTKNNLGFKDYGEPTETILESDHYDDFGRFLVDVIKHFKNEGVMFDYISPLNEPQYNWAPTEVNGTVSQEGSPWTNQNIYDVVNAIDQKFSANNIDTKLFISEAANVKYATGNSGSSANQLYHFWNPNSSLNLLNKSSVAKIMSYHSYFLDYGSNLITPRQDLSNRIQNLNIKPEAWQTEYSLLDVGYRSGHPDGYKLTEMETALSLARVMLADINVANVSAWQWWTTFEKGKFGGESRYNLIEVATKNDNTDGVYHLNKLYYTFGNFSHFIRPGMQRVEVIRSDNASLTNQFGDVVYSSYIKDDKLVLVAVNFSNEAKKTDVKLNAASEKELINMEMYLTNEFVSLSKQNVDLNSNSFIVPAQSVITLIGDLTKVNSVELLRNDDNVNAYYQKKIDLINVVINNNSLYDEVEVYNMSGSLVEKRELDKGYQQIKISALKSGIYLISCEGEYYRTTKKVIVY